MDNSQKKSGGLSKIIIGIIIGIFIGAVAFFLVNKFILNPDKDTNKTSDDIKEVESNENTIKEVKDTALIEKQLNKLVFKDELSLYYDEKVDTSVANDKRLIAFSVFKYIEDNNISYEYDPYNPGDYKDGYYIKKAFPKKEISNYMNKIYNTNIEYSYPATERFNEMVWIGCLCIIADDDNYYLALVGKSCFGETVHTKLIKAEEDNNNLYIYNNYLGESSETGTYWFDSFEHYQSNRDISDAIYKCNYGKCPVNEDSLIDYVFSNYSDKLNTFKHTFKKVDGNYYYVSTEIVK